MGFFGSLNLILKVFYRFNASVCCLRELGLNYRVRLEKLQDWFSGSENRKNRSSCDIYFINSA